MSEEEKKCGRIPLCGIVKSHTQDGDIEVQWLMGRTRNEDGKDTFVFWSSRLQPDLSSIPIGSWFYGVCDLTDYSGKYELVWVEKPSVCSEMNSRAENELDRIPLKADAIPRHEDVVKVNNACKEITVGLMFDRSQESEQEKEKQKHLRSVYRKYDDRLASLYFDMSEEMSSILPEPFLQAINSHRVLTSKTAREKRVELLKGEKDGTMWRKEYLARNNEINTEMNLKSIEFLLSFLRCIAYNQQS